MTCDEAPEEPASVSTEQVLKIECNITISTNYMLSGIMNVRRILYVFVMVPMGLSPYSLLTKSWRKTRLVSGDKPCTRKNQECQGCPATSQCTWYASLGERISAKRPKSWLVISAVIGHPPLICPSPTLAKSEIPVRV